MQFRSFVSVLVFGLMPFVSTAQDSRIYPTYFNSVSKKAVQKDKIEAVQDFADFVLEVGLLGPHITVDDKRFQSSGGGHVSRNKNSIFFANTSDSKTGTHYVIVLREDRKLADPIPVFLSHATMFGLNWDSFFDGKIQPIFELNPETDPLSLREFLNEAKSDESKLIIYWSILGLENSDANRSELQSQTENSLEKVETTPLALKILEAEFSNDLEFLKRLEEKYISGSSEISKIAKQTLALIAARAGVLTEGVFEQLRNVAATHPQYIRRMEALVILGRNPSESNQVAIAKALGDSDSDVSKTAYNQLNGNRMETGLIKTLSSVYFSARNYSVRIMVLHLISQNEDQKSAASAIIPGLTDSDTDVSNKAYLLLSKIPMDSSEVPLLLTALQNSRSYVVRINVLNLLAQNSDVKGALKAMIPSLSDSDNDVSNKAYLLLSKMPMDSSEVPLLLTALQNSRSYVVRINVLNLLAQNSDLKGALKAMIPSLSDFDTDVSNKAYLLLSKMPMDSSEVPLLAAVLRQAKSYQARINILNLLSRNSDQNLSLGIIIEGLKDTDTDVSNRAGAILFQTKNLNSTHVPTLAAAFANNRYGVRVMVAKILGNIPCNEALDALLNQLEVENDSDVKSALTSAIRTVRNKLKTK